MSNPTVAEEASEVLFLALLGATESRALAAMDADRLCLVVEAPLLGVGLDCRAPRGEMEGEIILTVAEGWTTMFYYEKY